MGAADATDTVADAEFEPPEPEHVSVYVLDDESAPVLWLPERSFEPLHAPEAVQLLAFVEDQLSVEDCPEATDVGFAESDTDGGELDTDTVADRDVEPPVPVQVSVNVLEEVSAPVLWLPERPLEPLHAPEAVQLLAFAEDQLSVEDCPEATEVGFADNVTVGAELDPLTVTVVDAEADPPVPEQVSV